MKLLRQLAFVSLIVATALGALRLAYSQGHNALVEVLIWTLLLGVAVFGGLLGYLTMMELGIKRHPDILWVAKAYDVTNRRYVAVWLTADGIYSGTSYSSPKTCFYWKSLDGVTSEVFSLSGVRQSPGLKVISRGLPVIFGFIGHPFGFSRRLRDACLDLCKKGMRHEWH